MSRAVVVFAALFAACSTPAPEPEPVTEPIVEPAPAPAPAPAPEVGPAPVVPDGPPGVLFLAPAEGATVTSPVHVVMGVRGKTVHAAGEIIEGTGHHHVLVDDQPAAAGVVVPADATHIHFGRGQHEADIELTPGAHTLTLQFADGLHASYGPEWSQTIHVTVAEAPAAAPAPAAPAPAGH
jgi:hypothetical protein